MLTPVDIETVEFKRVARGYAAEDVDEFLNKVMVEFESLYKENTSLKDRIKNLEESVEYYKSLEETLKNSIILAEKTSRQAKRNAAETAENIVRDAKVKAEQIIVDANKKRYEYESRVVELKARYEVLAASVRNILTAELEYVNNSEELMKKSVFAKVEEEIKAEKEVEKSAAKPEEETPEASSESATVKETDSTAETQKSDEKQNYRQNKRNKAGVKK